MRRNVGVLVMGEGLKRAFSAAKRTRESEFYQVEIGGRTYARFVKKDHAEMFVATLSPDVFPTIVKVTRARL